MKRSRIQIHRRSESVQAAAASAALKSAASRRWRARKTWHGLTHCRILELTLKVED